MSLNTITSHKCVNDLFFLLSKNESLSVKQKHSGGLKYLNNGDWLSVCAQICVRLLHNKSSNYHSTNSD